MRPERRGASRFRPDGRDPLSYARLRTGSELRVVDLCASGALVEGAARLLPGSSVDLHLSVGGGRVLVRTRVVRSSVSVLRPAIAYRSALAFDRPIDLLPRSAVTLSVAG